MKTVTAILASIIIPFVVHAAGGPDGLPSPYYSFTLQGSDTNQASQSLTGDYAAFNLFSGQIFSLTNMTLTGADGYIYGGTNYQIAVSVGNLTEGSKTWDVFGDGSTNYYGYHGAWTASTSWWAHGLYIPLAYTTTVYMQVRVIDLSTGRSFIYPQRAIPYHRPIQ